jgi:hypothetical protein
VASLRLNIVVLFNAGLRVIGWLCHRAQCASFSSLRHTSVTDELADLQDKRSALKAHIYKLKNYIKDMELDLRAAKLEVQVTKARLIDVEIDLATVQNERDQ